MSLGPARHHPWHTLSGEEMRQRQVEKLAAYLRGVVLPNNAFYRRHFAEAGFDPSGLRTPADLQRIPMCSKEDFASPEAVLRYILSPDAKALARRPSTVLRTLLNGREQVRQELAEEFRPLMMTSTTGRSAEPVPFLYTARDLEILAITGERVMRVSGATPGQKMMNVFPFAPHLAFWITHYAGVAFGAMMVSTGGGKTLGTDGNLRMLRKLHPEVLIGVPTYLYHLLSAAVQEGMQLPELKKIVLGGEKAPAGMKRRLTEYARLLGAPKADILCCYGFTEAKMAWGECPHPVEDAASGYHLSPELALFEVVDPDTGEPMREGEPGEIVFTPLEARGSVVIRYRTGDLISGGLSWRSCPYCGRNVPRLVGEISRRSEIREMRLEKLRGTLVDFNALEHLLDDCERLQSWQLELRKRNDDPHDLDELVLHVQARYGSSEEDVIVELDHLLPTRLEVRANRVIFHDGAGMRILHGVDRELKEARIVDRRPPAGSRTKGEVHV